MKELQAFFINTLSDIPSQIVPILTVGAVVIALLLLIVFFGICVFYINSKPKTVVRRDQTKSDPAKEITPQKVRHEDLPWISGRLGEILALHGFIHSGSITKIFLQVLEVMKNSTYDLRWRYKLPCFMMIGPEQSGKTTLLNSLNLEHLNADGMSINSMWKLFKKGAIFELPTPDSTENSKKFLSFICDLFSFIRPRRPLDGLILTIPADILLDGAVKTGKYASDMFTRIFELQHEINFRLPIYIIVTKTDLINGFSEFAHLFNEASKQQLFGWSCPYTLKSSFSSEWINDMFTTFDNGIRKAVLHLAKEKQTNSDLQKAILFETYFANIKQSLATYLNEMFHSHNPEDGLLLRGVYFVGKQKENELSHELIQPGALNPSLLTNIEAHNSYNNNLYFVQDIFTEKIFKEYNIAYPINSNAMEISHVAFRNKVILATGATVFSIGWFIGNYNIRSKISDYSQSLLSLKNNMLKLRSIEKHSQGIKDLPSINKYTSNLLQNMITVKRWELCSIFVPQSWFSTLRKNINDVVGLTFDSVVVRAMYIDLNINTKTMLTDFSQAAGASYRKKDLFDTKSFRSFKDLKTFTERILKLTKLSAEYNSIRSLEDRQSIIDLTSTLFKDNFDISKEMKDRVPNKRLLPPKFDLKIFQPNIEKTIAALFSKFLKDVFDVTIEKIIQNVVNDINTLSNASKDITAKYTPQNLAKLHQKIELITDILKNKSFDWISASRFCPNQEYTNIIKVLESSEVISSQYYQTLIKDSEVQFAKFKSRLLSYKSSMTDGMLSPDIRSPSLGLQALNRELKTLLEQSFITAVPEKHIVKDFSQDKMLIWDIKRLKKMSDLIDKYYTFAENPPAELRVQYAETYRSIARKCFHPTLESTIASSQIFEDIPLEHSKELLEEAYKKQSSNVRNVISIIAKIAKFLDDSEEDDEHNNLGLCSFLASYYFSVLNKVDEIFNKETPYTTGGAVFDNWNGHKTPRFLDFDDNNRLKEYLTAQFERIRFLAKDLASPLVDILSIPYIANHIRNRNIINKWKEIISNVNDYEGKKPGNSIAALEEFITNTLSKVTSTGIDSDGEIKVISETKGDFFISKRSEVAQMLLSRADVVKYDKAAATYNVLHKLFNRTLKNKFPFGLSNDDATVKDIESLITIYDHSCKNLLSTLEEYKTQKHINEKALDFLQKMDNVVSFLKTWLQHIKSSDTSNASLVFNIQNRPSPNIEAFTSSLIDRIVDINGVQIENNSNGIFYNNDKVNVTFKWIDSSEEKPNNKVSGTNLSIDGYKAQYTYAGKWAMFRLIEEHKINKETESENGILVQFSIPIIDSSKGNAEFISKIVLKITPMQKDGDKAVPIVWPLFPSTCPNLHGADNNDEEHNDHVQNIQHLDVDVNFDDPLPNSDELDDGKTTVI